MPPPQPVPMITPKTIDWPGPRPVRGFGEGETIRVVLHPHRAGRAARREVLTSKRWPFSAMVLAFFTRPVAGLMIPGDADADAAAAAQFLLDAADHGGHAG